MNWLNNGHLPIILPTEARTGWQTYLGDTKVTIDLENNKVIAGDKEYIFELEETWKERLLRD